MTSYTLFISDLHLNPEDAHKTKLFLDFLHTEALHAEALYILGDLFEVWIGDDDSSAFSTKIRNGLKTCSAKIPIYIMPGNRDFLLGEIFAHDTNCKLLTDPSVIDLYGTPTLLTHGDLLCTNDIGHQRFRKYAYNKKYNRFFLLLPFPLRKAIAKLIRKISINNKKSKSTTTKKIVPETINNFLSKYKAEQIIYGHTHRAQNSYHHFVLGEWNDNPYILKIDKK